MSGDKHSINPAKHGSVRRFVDGQRAAYGWIRLCQTRYWEGGHWTIGPCPELIGNCSRKSDVPQRDENPLVCNEFPRSKPAGLLTRFPSQSPAGPVRLDLAPEGIRLVRMCVLEAPTSSQFTVHKPAGHGAESSRSDSVRPKHSESTLTHDREVLATSALNESARQISANQSSRGRAIENLLDVVAAGRSRPTLTREPLKQKEDPPAEKGQ